MHVSLELWMLITAGVVGYILCGLFICWLQLRIGGEFHPDRGAPPLGLTFLSWPILFMIGVILIVGYLFDCVIRWLLLNGDKK